MILGDNYVSRHPLPNKSFSNLSESLRKNS
uniref:PFU domain-containing protein n=1 Tax=Rhizophora mucronata TaxID=61149 RepID=A0A2P2J0M6_RHIMU